MKFLLDTDHASVLQRASSKDAENILKRMQECSRDDFSLSIIGFHEQVKGALDILSQANDKASKLQSGYSLLFGILNAYKNAKILPFDARALEIYDRLSQEVRIIKRMRMDFRIASIAIAHNLVLLTRNARDFERVPGLRIEDWTQ
ncbi:MAG: type II toxin-antitoxin system VapC family toxin [Cyanobacteria bacterium P01_F01_bin.33]